MKYVVSYYDEYANHEIRVVEATSEDEACYFVFLKKEYATKEEDMSYEDYFSTIPDAYCIAVELNSLME